MDSNLVTGLIVGAGAAGVAVFFYLQGKITAAKDAARREAQAEADGESKKTLAKAQELEKAANEAKAAAEAEAKRVQLEADATRKALAIEEAALKTKGELLAKEAAIKAKQDAESALESKRVEVTRHEQRIQTKEETLDRKGSAIDQRETELLRRESKAREQEKAVFEQEKKYADLVTEAKVRLEKAAGLSSEDAKKQVIDGIVEDAKRTASRDVMRLEEEAHADAEARAKRIVGIAIQRYAGGYAVERTVTSVHIPSDDMKGRLIGRQGRNIQALEAALGIDIIIDDTPETIILSGYNPVRREVGRRAIEQLLKDGRVHPARIEECVTKATADVESSLKEFGEKAALEIGVTGLHPEVIRLMGSLRYRTSYTQNQWEHALEVGFLVGEMAAELKLNVKDARRAGFLHDLGKAVSHEVEGGHAVIGADLAKKYGEKDHIVHAIRAHHDDVKPETVLAHLVAAGDAISGARPGARSEKGEAYLKRLEDLEKISLSFPGVERAYAIQAGREMRVIVDNGRISDEAAVMLSRDIARKVEEELTYPGQIKVTVIRETRAVDIAR